jgi:hypothetical protein
MQVFATKIGEQFSQRAVMVAQRNWELRNLTIKSDKEDGRAGQPKDYMLKKHGSGGGSVKLGAQELDNIIRQVFAMKMPAVQPNDSLSKTWQQFWLSEIGSSRT